MVMTAVVLTGFGISSFVHFVNTDMSAYQPDSSISVSKDGFTLYTEGGTVRPADLSCTASGRTQRCSSDPSQGKSRC